MIAEKEQSILEEVRAMKEQNAERHGFSVDAIIDDARVRQEASGRKIVRLHKKTRATNAMADSAMIG